MSSKTPEAVQTQLAALATNNASTNQLVFDPATGDLVVQTPGEAKPSIDAAPIDQVAADGFFA